MSAAERDGAAASEPAHSGERPTGDASRAADLAGQLIGGKYRLRHMFSQGGMGSLWVAQNEALDVAVAVKLIRADVESWLTPVLANRLLLEARASAKLGHPAIVRTLDYGNTDAGDPFIVMELLEGEDLASALERRGRISPKKAIRVMLPIVHALAAVHVKNIVHRDVKPDNIFLATSDGGTLQPKLIDFGVAKLRKKHSKRITAAGALLGSPAYMAPEQARGDEADYPADVWAVCVVLYEMITGRLPFEGKNYSAIMRSVIEDEVPPITAFGAGDDELWRLLEWGLHKEPERRWHSMHALGEALAHWAASRGVTDDICGASLESVWLADKSVPPGEDALSSIPPPSHPSLDDVFGADRIDTLPVGETDWAGDSSRLRDSGRAPLPSDPFGRMPDVTPISARSLPSDPIPHSRTPVRISQPSFTSEPPVGSEPPVSQPEARAVRPSLSSISELPEIQRELETQRIAAASADLRFRWIVMAVTVVVLVLGTLTIWRLTSG